ncbi:phosphatidylserine/phosphatidylglycerophosphate/cardiolipin synthase family protein [Actinoplanes sp. RD1]|uniref:phosphatidylserine/phosphatidylglycerophosphate/ cardiolipin synthase family protein n=1 Tax=Actinoplanes sp. RD1 TaxID=3064538 RepID=UPI0027424ED9|nr:phosphatidylserine/phosphatidylglycerophosphate/cardiolipin synthase family protein [Actinoplanes sp. RD1]
MQLRTKILVSVVAGGATYLLTNATSQPEIWQLTMSVFVGGIVLVTQVLLGYDTKVTELQALVDRRFRAVSTATDLYARVESHALAERINRLVQSTRGLKADPLTQRFVDHELDRLIGMLDGLRHGWAFYVGEDRDWLLGLTACANKSIDATSMTSFGNRQGYVDEEYWETDSGQRYLALQRRAIAERGVRIRRLFLLDEDTQADESLLSSLLAPHQAIGVEIRVLQPAKLDFLLRTDMFDFILFDGSLSYELRSALSVEREARPAIASVTLVSDWRVDDRRRRFDQMWQAAEVSEEPSTSAATASAQPQDKLTPEPP